MNGLKEGDNLIVSELSGLGCSMLEVMEILAIGTEKKINIYSVKGNWHLDGSLQSKILAMAFSMASEIERDLMSSRTKEALATRKAKGVILGIPKGTGKSKLDEFSPEIEGLLNNGSTKRFVANRYKVTVQSLHNWIKKNIIQVKYLYQFSLSFLFLRKTSSVVSDMLHSSEHIKFRLLQIQFQPV